MIFIFNLGILTKNVVTSPETAIDKIAPLLLHKTIPLNMNAKHGITEYRMYLLAENNNGSPNGIMVASKSAKSFASLVSSVPTPSSLPPYRS